MKDIEKRVMELKQQNDLMTKDLGFGVVSKEYKEFKNKHNINYIKYFAPKIK